MSADFWTSIKMEGNETELLSLLKIVRMYTVEKHEQYRSKRDCAYLSDAYLGQIGGKRIQDLSDDELIEAIKESNGQIFIEASGPYGIFYLLEEVDLFEEMADAAPTAKFEGIMSGFSADGDQAFKAILENGMMRVFNSYPKDDVCFDDEDETYEDEDEDEEKWDEESVYIPIPAIAKPASYVAQMINKGKLNVEFEKHNFAVSDSCIEKNSIIKAIEGKGGKVRKSVGKTTHYVVLGNNIKGYDHMVIDTISLNSDDKDIKVVTEEEILTLLK